MKLLNIATALAVMSSMTLVSCSEGQYWTELSNPGTAVAFAKPAETVTVDAEDELPASWDVIVTRNSADGELTVPVTFTSTSEVLSGPSQVTFKAGELSAVYQISIDTAEVELFTTYAATVELPEYEKSMVKVDPSNLSFTFSFTQNLTLAWEAAGTASTISLGWVGNEEPVDIPVYVATNWIYPGEKVVRLESPYWYLEPEYATKGQGDIMFIVDANDDVVRLYQPWQYIGEVSDGMYFMLGAPASYKGSFTNDGNHYVLNGLIAYAESLTSTTLTPYAYEVLEFDWNK